MKRRRDRWRAGKSSHPLFERLTKKGNEHVYIERRLLLHIHIHTSVKTTLINLILEKEKEG